MTITDPEQACAELLTVVERLEGERQWVPVEWLPRDSGRSHSDSGRSHSNSQESLTSHRSEVNRMSGSVHSSNQSINSRSTKHSVIAHVEPEPRDRSPVAAKARKAKASPRLSAVSKTERNESTADDVRLIPADSCEHLVKGSGKWVELI